MSTVEPVITGDLPGWGRIAFYGPPPFERSPMSGFVDVTFIDRNSIMAQVQLCELARFADELEGLAHRIRSYADTLEVRS